MKKVAVVLAATVALMDAVTPAAADGWRRAGRAYARSSVYDVHITRNVITPYYYPYYGSHYSYVRPDPVPPPTYVLYPPVVVVCWGFSPLALVC